MSSAGTRQYWRIEGGSATGGIIVRTGKGITAKEADEKLSNGAIVLEKEVVGNRLNYELVYGLGNGPKEGWISMKMMGTEIAQKCDAPKSIPKAPEKMTDLSDPDNKFDLEVREEELYGLKCVIRARPIGSPKAPIVVLMLPGNPKVVGWHANMTLPLAVDKAFGDACFPVVRFDWDGTGMNAPGSHPPSESYEAVMPDTYKMFEGAKMLGEKVCVCAWNFSGTIAGRMAYEKWPDVCAMISMSFAYKQWEFVVRVAGEEAGLALKQEFEDHAKIEMPSLYVFGDKDVHTPLEEVQRITKNRADGGSGATINVISQAGQKFPSTDYFRLRDKEEEVGLACATWLHDVRGQMLSESPSSGA